MIHTKDENIAVNQLNDKKKRTQSFQQLVNNYEAIVHKTQYNNSLHN